VGRVRPLPGPTLDEIRQEYERLGWDCVEVLRGDGLELYKAGKASYVEDSEGDVIVVRFERRSQSND